jgi:hypothetical protein
MKASSTIGIFLTLLAASSYGRVGETVKQVEARYGKPQQLYIDRPDLRKALYGYRGFMVMVYFSGGISKRESFGRPDLPKLAPDTVKELLALSAREGTSWQPILKEHDDYYWVSSDKKVVAQFAAPGNLLLVQDRKFHSSE